MSKTLYITPAGACSALSNNLEIFLIWEDFLDYKISSSSLTSYLLSLASSLLGQKILHSQI